MKQPNPRKLKVNQVETEKIRSKMMDSRPVKITINIEAKSLQELRKLSKDSGVPYQRLLNRMLKEGLAGKQKTESRLDQLEKELRRLKQKIAA